MHFILQTNLIPTSHLPATCRPLPKWDRERGGGGKRYCPSSITPWQLGSHDKTLQFFLRHPVVHLINENLFIDHCQIIHTYYLISLVHSKHSFSMNRWSDHYSQSLSFLVNRMLLPSHLSECRFFITPPFPLVSLAPLPPPPPLNSNVVF